MSWQLVSFLILGAGLLAGFAWYERSRPPSQVVALVAALAALAIAGRIAFAAFPNVKPTTDIVIFAGYALGGAPGFAVGALTALVSNFWFGQGPWTPWQMAGWGFCGLLGAAVALGWRNIGRFGLAAVCGSAGLIYGALLNFSLMATYGGDLSWQRFVLYEGRAVPFEVAHVAGNIAFALVAGPAMLRMLTRFRERFEWRRADAREPAPRAAPRLGGGVAVLAVVLALGAFAPARASADVGAAANWLGSVQNADGGWGNAAGERSTPETTCWAMLGLEAAGVNPFDARAGGRSPIEYLRGSLDQVKSPGDLARTIVALEGAGIDPRNFGGQNLVSRLLAKRRKDGSYEAWPTTTAFAVIALRGAGADGAVEKTMDWLRETQGDDGGWGDAPGGPSTADTTGAVLQVLARDSKPSRRALSYLTDVQRKGGGFPLGGNGAVNSQSTAWAIQGIVAAGHDPDSFRKGGASGLDYLAAQQQSDGHYRYSKSSDQTPVWVTGDAMVAAAGDYFPLTPPPRKAKPQQHSEPTQTEPAETSPSLGSSPESGGLPPSTVPGTSHPDSGSGSSASSGDSSGGGGGTSAGHSAPSGEIPPGESPSESTGGASAGGPTTTAPGETSASSEEASESNSGGTSTLGAIVTGLLAGCLLFACAWAARKGWMRWRYGL